MKFSDKLSIFCAKIFGFRWFTILVLLIVPLFLLWPVLFGRVLGGYDAASLGVLFDGFGGMHNSINADPYYQFAPWWELMKRSVAELTLPVWNEYSGLGQPLWANMQSAPLSFFTWLVLLFGLKWGIVIGSFLKLFIAGGGMYVFFKISWKK
jgi:hypothetical protein